jgi:hypothetical protein
VAFGRPCAGLLYGRQAFAPHPATIAQDRPAAFLRVAREETMLPFAADLRRLILSFHMSVQFLPGDVVS